MPKLQSMGQEVTPLRTMVLIEELASSLVAGVEAAASSCRAEARMYQKPADLLRELGSSGADVVIMPAAHPKAAEICAAVRKLVGLQTAVIGVARQVDGLAFAEFVGWGGDDLVQGDSGRSLAARLRAIREDLAQIGSRRASSMRREDGRFLLIAPPTSELMASVRLIQQSGHHTVVVENLTDGLARLAVGRDIKVVLDARLPGAVDFVDHALRQGNCAGLVVACNPQQLGQLSKRYDSNGRVVVLDSCSPADAVLLAANNLTTQTRTRRSTERLLYSTVVRFREVGGEYDHVGCTYNVSAGGLYIRTLAMPKGDKVWVEVTPPGSMERVRLEGRVAWRTPVSRGADCPTPVGFGIEITDATKSSLDGWKAGYRSLQSKLEIDPTSQSRPDLRLNLQTDSKAGQEVDHSSRPTVRVKRGPGSLQTLRVEMDLTPLPIFSTGSDPSRSPTVKVEMDPASLPTVRPPSATRQKVNLWSSMNSGPSATYLPGQSVPLQKSAQVAAIDSRPSRGF
jgi:hypothetical protein